MYHTECRLFIWMVMNEEGGEGTVETLSNKNVGSCDWITVRPYVLFLLANLHTAPITNKMASSDRRILS